VSIQRAGIRIAKKHVHYNTIYSIPRKSFKLKITINASCCSVITPVICE